MSKLRATRAQVIAAAIIVVLAVVLGGVGLYGMNARGSENGAQVLENMRLQAILNTAGSGAVDAYVAAHGLAQVSDAGLVAQVVEQVLSANEKSVADYRSGKEKAFGFLVGQVMRELRGQASPQVVNQIIRERLEQVK